MAETEGSLDETLRHAKPAERTRLTPYVITQDVLFAGSDALPVTLVRQPITRFLLGVVHWRQP